MKPNPWERNLREGERAHKIAMERLKDWRLKIKVESYSGQSEQQRQGIDSKLLDDHTTYDTKVRDFRSRKYGDLLIETRRLEDNKPGWYYTSKADFIAYVWWNPKKTDLYEGYLINLQDPRFRSWFEKNLGKFEEKKALSVAEGGRQWHTMNRAVPIPIFPNGVLFKFIQPPGKGWGFHGEKRLDDFIR